MVLEQFLKYDWVEKRLPYVFILGIAYVFIGYFVAFYFFGNSVSIAMLFLATLLIMPTIGKLLGLEEKRESKEGLRHFFRNHRDIFEIYHALFLGIFVGYISLTLFVADTSTLYDYQVSFLEQREGLNKGLIENFLITPLQPRVDTFLTVVSSNISVLLIFFFLSLFYGAGGIFLVVLNASVFSTLITTIIAFFGRSFGQVISILGIFLIHLIPEVSGFLIAAIAGGVVSKALTQERWMSKRFQNVMKDAAILLMVSLILVMIAGLLEIFVSTTLVQNVLR